MDLLRGHDRSASRIPWAASIDLRLHPSTIQAEHTVDQAFIWEGAQSFEIPLAGSVDFDWAREPEWTGRPVRSSLITYL